MYSESDESSFRFGRKVMPNRTVHAGTFVRRHAEASVPVVLSETRVVAILGPRQSGKTTLARRFADDDGRAFVSLGDDQFKEGDGDSGR